RWLADWLPARAKIESTVVGRSRTPRPTQAASHAHRRSTDRRVAETLAGRLRRRQGAGTCRALRRRHRPDGRGRRPGRRAAHVAEDAPSPYFAMQLLRGQTLAARIDRENRLPACDVIAVGRQVAAGLAHAHERGLVHRDVKPLNLWLEEGTGRVKILDFGLVR